MFSQRAPIRSLLAIAALLMMVGQGYGQQNALVFPWQAPAGRPGGYIPRGETFAPAAPTFNSSGNVENSRAFYPGSSDGEPVLMNVTVPANAKVNVQGAKTAQTGAFRRFVSPPIASGYQYTYDVEATWMENGREVRQRRSFPVHPGEVVNITITGNGVTVQPKN